MTDQIFDEKLINAFESLRAAWLEAHGSPMPWNKACIAYGLIFGMSRDFVQQLINLDN